MWIAPAQPAGVGKRQARKQCFKVMNAVSPLMIPTKLAARSATLSACRSRGLPSCAMRRLVIGLVPSGGPYNEILRYRAPG